MPCSGLIPSTWTLLCYGHDKGKLSFLGVSLVPATCPKLCGFSSPGSLTQAELVGNRSLNQCADDRCPCFKTRTCARGAVGASVSRHSVLLQHCLWYRGAEESYWRCATYGSPGSLRGRAGAHTLASIFPSLGFSVISPSSFALP